MDINERIRSLKKRLEKLEKNDIINNCIFNLAMVDILVVQNFTKEKFPLHIVENICKSAEHLLLRFASGVKCQVCGEENPYINDEGYICWGCRNGF